MRRCLGYLFTLGLLLVLTGCGQKGPLYLPDNSDSPQSDKDRED